MIQLAVTVAVGSLAAGLLLAYLLRHAPTVGIQLAGLDSTMARALLVGKAQLQAEFVKAACDGKPDTVIAVSPHAPTVVHKGDTMTVTLCVG